MVAEPIHDTAHTSEAEGTIGPSVRALTHVCTHTWTHTAVFIQVGPKRSGERGVRGRVCAFGY